MSNNNNNNTSYFDTTPPTIFYLENQDISPDGSLNFSLSSPSIILIQGNFCGYCTQMKPEFSKFAGNYADKLFIGTIQIDGNPDEKELAKRLSSFIPNYKGVPIVVGYDANGKFVKVYEGDRTAEGISSFAEELLSGEN